MDNSNTTRATQRTINWINLLGLLIIRKVISQQLPFGMISAQSEFDYAWPNPRYESASIALAKKDNTHTPPLTQTLITQTDKSLGF